MCKKNNKYSKELKLKAVDMYIYEFEQRRAFK